MSPAAKLVSIEPGSKMIDAKDARIVYRAEGYTQGRSTMDGGRVEWVKLDDGREVLVDIKDMAAVPV